MREDPTFSSFFQGQALNFLLKSIDLALEEDDQDLTSKALFAPDDLMQAEIKVKEPAIIAGLPLSEKVFSRIDPLDNKTEIKPMVREGAKVNSGQIIAAFHGPALSILRAERIILNFLSHLSGIATLTHEFVKITAGTKTQLIDTRKTHPGLRYPEKYAVLAGGGHNHRMNLGQLLMLKDNHIDRAGSITKAVRCLRQAYSPCPPIEVECRSPEDVQEAVACQVNQIMLDNMTVNDIQSSLQIVPQGIKTEISGGVNLDNLSDLAHLGADCISVGYINHSAKSIDMSMNLSSIQQGMT